MDNLNKLNLDEYKPLRDVVFENLREAIVEGRLKPGQRLMEVQLAEQLGVSRTPVREALQRLVLEGFLEKSTGNGYVIKNYRIVDLIEVLQIRKALERLAGELVVEKIDEEGIEKLKQTIKKIEKTLRSKVQVNRKGFKEISYKFHDTLFEITKNTRLIKLRKNIEDHIRFITTIELNIPQRFYESLEEDKAILNAVISKNKRQAIELSERHVENIINHILNDFKNK